MEVDTEWRSVVHHMHNPITDDNNESFMQQTTHQEVKKVSFHMHPDKSPGPDGMTHDFY